MACDAAAREHRLEIAPAMVTNLAKGHAGSFMGGSLTADYYFSDWAGLRTTLGFTKERYYPAELDYSDANYGFWLSVAPMAQANIGGVLRPYVAFLGTISGVGQRRSSGQPLAGLELSPVRNLGYDDRASQTLFSLGASIGTKLVIAGPVSLFGEVTHYVYSHVTTAENYFPESAMAFGRPLDFERNPTYLSLGLVYSLRIGRQNHQ